MAKKKKYEVIYASQRYNEPHKAIYIGYASKEENVAKNFLKRKDYPCKVISVTEIGWN